MLDIFIFENIYVEYNWIWNALSWRIWKKNLMIPYHLVLVYQNKRNKYAMIQWWIELIWNNQRVHFICSKYGALNFEYHLSWTPLPMESDYACDADFLSLVHE